MKRLPVIVMSIGPSATAGRDQGSNGQFLSVFSEKRAITGGQ